MRAFVLILCAVVVLASRRNYEVYQIELSARYFQDFMTTYNKVYANEAEKAKRLQIFTENLKIINKRNLESRSAVYGINKFSDLTPEEFVNRYTGLRLNGREGHQTQCENRSLMQTNATSPESFDWRDQKKVSRVKDQGRCGSCWAFSATGNLESQYAIKENEILELSEQQLVDCDTVSQGCQGTDALENPFVYWMKNSGAMLDKDYSYEARDAKCRFDESKVKVKVSGCAVYSIKSEDKLKDLLYEVGPLTIGVDASSFSLYKGGVHMDCSGEGVNHAVLLVGYGKEDDVPFWLIKNSWGTSYGENGYIKVQRGVNACAMMEMGAVVALLA